MSCTNGRLAGSGDRQFVKNRLVLTAVCLTLLAAPFAWNASVGESGPVLCASRGLFGLPCPGCGMTRAFCALSNFEIGKATQLNGLCLPLVVLIVAAPCVALRELWLGRRLGWYAFIGSRGFVLLLAIAISIFHVTRLILWARDGTLLQTYLKSGLLYRLMFGTDS